MHTTDLSSRSGTEVDFQDAIAGTFRPEDRDPRCVAVGFVPASVWLDGGVFCEDTQARWVSLSYVGAGQDRKATTDDWLLEARKTVCKYGAPSVGPEGVVSAKRLSRLVPQTRAYNLAAQLRWASLSFGMLTRPEWSDKLQAFKNFVDTEDGQRVIPRRKFSAWKENFEAVRGRPATAAEKRKTCLVVGGDQTVAVRGDFEWLPGPLACFHEDYDFSSLGTWPVYSMTRDVIEYRGVPVFAPVTGTITAYDGSSLSYLLSDGRSLTVPTVRNFAWEAGLGVGSHVCCGKLLGRLGLDIDLGQDPKTAWWTLSKYFGNHLEMVAAHWLVGHVKRLKTGVVHVPTRMVAGRLRDSDPSGLVWDLSRSLDYYDDQFTEGLVLQPFPSRFGAARLAVNDRWQDTVFDLRPQAGSWLPRPCRWFTDTSSRRRSEERRVKLAVRQTMAMMAFVEAEEKEREARERAGIADVVAARRARALTSFAGDYVI